jgi:hypothetical protein
MTGAGACDASSLRDLGTDARDGFHTRSGPREHLRGVGDLARNVGFSNPTRSERPYELVDGTGLDRGL